MVLRDGVHITIPAKELVPGDIIFLETGCFIPADARLLNSINLKVDESSLTGESSPVSKNANLILKENTPLAEQINLVPSSGIVTCGRGTAVVTATGMQTQVGQIAKLILEENNPKNILGKGYSILEDGDGNVISSAEDFVPGRSYKLTFRDGSVVFTYNK